MKSVWSRWAGAAVVAACCAVGGAAEPAAETVVGWRGNLTGSFPEATPPLEWGRKAKSFVAELSEQAARPTDGAGRSGEKVVAGMVRDWLVMGPIAVEDVVHNFDKPAVPGEAQLRPAEGESVGELKWKRLHVDKEPDWKAWGTAELEYVDLAKPLGFVPGAVGYAHSYLYADRAGKVAFIMDHSDGGAAWVNGEPLYSAPNQAMGLWVYPMLSRQRVEQIYNRSPRFEATLKKGWNSLLVKVGTYPAKDAAMFKFTLRLMDVEPVTYEEKNIAWMADLGERTNATPIVVGEKLFTVAEPDILICLDKRSGKELWRAYHHYYAATPEAERAANPAFAAKVEPLSKALEAERDMEKVLELRRKMNDELVAIDKEKYKMKWDGHFAGHFAIVGFTTTPVSDGQHVWAFYGQGVVACYDLDGHRQWITRLQAPELVYSCSPAYIHGKLVCVFGGMWGLDAATGKVLWNDEESKSIAALIPATIHGVDVVADKSGNVFRAADGKKLWANPHLSGGDAGWSPAVILGDVMYQPMFGVCNLVIADFSKVEGDVWKPTERSIDLDVVHKKPDGHWWDRNTAGSPLIVGGRAYVIDQYGEFYAVDLASGKTLYHQDTGFDELHHYNAIGVGASATLGGSHVFVIDNQGECLVLEPGDVFKPVARNKIGTLLPRDWPIGPQELLSNAAPLFDGGRIYFRGERYLYCIAEPGNKK
jgi:outer membrane protein assembly factor BamB